jgi:hypothetical protein
MWLGKVGIPGRKIETIAEIAEIPLLEVLKNEIDKLHNLEIEDWHEAFEKFIENHRRIETRVSKRQ